MRILNNMFSFFFRRAITKWWLWLLLLPLAVGEDRLLGWLNRQIDVEVGSFMNGLLNAWNWLAEDSLGIVGVAFLVILLVIFSYAVVDARKFRIPQPSQADLIRAQAALQKEERLQDKQDQVREGLRDPKAAQKAPEKASKSTERLERLYSEGEQLLTLERRAGAKLVYPSERDKSVPPREWRQKIINWFDQSEAAVKEDAPNAAFMFRTFDRRPKPDEKFDDCPKLLEARLAKLRLIIGRMHANRAE